MTNPNDRTILYTRDIHDQGQSAYVVYLPGDPAPLAVDHWGIEPTENLVRFYRRGRTAPIAACPNRGWVAYQRDLLAETSVQDIHAQTRQTVQDALASLGVKTVEPPIKWAA